MSKLIDHTFVITGNEQALGHVLRQLEALQNEFPGAAGIMEWSEFVRTPGRLEFYFFDTHYFVSQELMPRLADWSDSEDIAVRFFSWTSDGELGAWIIHIENGKAENVAGWDWPHPAEVQELLLSLEESPTPNVVVQLLQEMGYLDDSSSGVGIAEALMEVFDERSEFLEDADVQNAMLEIKEQEWSDEDIEEFLCLDGPDDIEPLLQFYRLRQGIMMKRQLPPGKDGEIRAV